jgi:hypothetical protein
MIDISDASTWEDVQIGAKVGFASSMSPTCIHGSKQNHDKAVQDFTCRSEDVRYFLIRDSGHNIVGYIRALVVGHVGRDKSWVLDFVTPFSYGACLLASRRLEGTVLVRSRIGADWYIGDRWPRIVAAFPRLDGYSHHQTSSHETVWLMVQK